MAIPSDPLNKLFTDEKNTQISGLFYFSPNFDFRGSHIILLHWLSAYRRGKAGADAGRRKTGRIWEMG